jgi:ADP-heptose:LPS heptosyltransferase
MPVLVMMDDCGPGDALALTGLLRSLREQLPGDPLVGLVSTQAAPVFARARVFDRLVVSRLYELRARSSTGLRLRKLVELARLGLALRGRYRMAINLWWGTTALDVLAVFLARRRIGFTHRLPFLMAGNLGRWDNSADPLSQNLAVLKAAGFEARPQAPFVSHTPADADNVGRLLAASGVASGAQIAVLHTGSDWACQQWQQAGWAELADRLVGRGFEVVFTGLAREGGYIDEIRSRMTNPSVSLAGRTGIGELCALLSIARVCVSVDSLPFEVSQAVGLPTVALAGPTRPDRVVPARRPARIVNRTHRALRGRINACKQPRMPNGGCLDYACPMSGLRQITVDEVIRAVEASL